MALSQFKIKPIASMTGKPEYLMAYSPQGALEQYLGHNDRHNLAIAKVTTTRRIEEWHVFDRITRKLFCYIERID